MQGSKTWGLGPLTVGCGITPHVGICKTTIKEVLRCDLLFQLDVSYEKSLDFEFEFEFEISPFVVV